MVTVKLYGMSFSTCTKRVWLVATEIGVEVEFVYIYLSEKQQKTPEFIENYHSFGVVPVPEDEDGTKIYESRTIARYLVVRYGKSSNLLPDPTDSKAYGLFEQATSIEYSSCGPLTSSLVYEEIFAPMKGFETNEGLCKKYIETLKTKMEGYERILSKQKYLAGENMRLADLFQLPWGGWVDQLQPEIFASQPHVKAWRADISSRKSYEESKKFTLDRTG